MYRSLWICCLALLVLLAGCGPEDERPHVTIWHQKTGAERTFFEQLIEEYNAQQDSFVVDILYRETEELRNLFVIASVGGKGPDLIYGPADNVGVLALTETIAPIDGVMPDSFLARFTEDGIVEWEDDPWLLADQVGNHLSYVYNTEIIPEPPRTTDELVATLRRVKEETGAYGLTWNYTEPFFFIPFLSGYGGWVMNEQGEPTLDTEATVEAIRFILELRDQGLIPSSSDYDVAEGLFKDRQAASIINGPWSWAGYGSAGIDYDIARIPRISETGEWAKPMVAAKGYSINVNLDEEKEPHVRELLTYLTGPEVQRRMARELAAIPVLEDVRDSDVMQENPILQASLRQAEVGRPMPIDPRMRQIWDGMRGPYQLIMNGEVTPEEGARIMQREVEKRIADTFL